MTSKFQYPANRSQFHERDYWRRQMVHEAGHAVAALALLDLSANIVVMNYTDENGKLQKHARFKFNAEILMRTPDLPAPPLEEQNLLGKIKMLAAAGIAETMFFGGPPRGAARDLGQIKRMMLTTGAIRPALIPPMAQEVDGGFPATKQLLREHWQAVTRIWKKAFYEFKRLRLAGKTDYEEIPVLYELQVRRLFYG